MPDTEDTEEERILPRMRRRLELRAALMIPIGLAAIFGAEFTLGFGFHMYTEPPRWPLIALVSSLAALIGAVGLTLAWWVTRLPPEFPSTRFILGQSDRVQRTASRVYGYYPFLLGLLAFDAALLIHNGFRDGWRFLDATAGFGFILGVVVFLPWLTGWGIGMGGGSRLIYDEELFRSFRTRGYIAGFWSVMAGLPLILALGLARPAWAVEALPVLIAIGLSVPAVTIARLNRRAERDA